ncbi:MAG: glycosyltransferase family 4 protein, partial [Planctomycetota bacterium]|nr:glycosyltransferase family 4 protein [Planctomycetota bacterium]
QLDLPTVRACLKAAHIFLIPSLWENCPYSCIEAMTAGRAIVSSDCGGMPELIRHRENGLLAKNGDPDSFVEALKEMIEDDALADACGRNARAEVEDRLTDVKIAQRSVDVYQSYIDGNPMATESRADRVARLAAQSAASGADAEALRAQVARLNSELAASKRREADLQGRADSKIGRRLLNVLRLGARRKGR